MVDWNALLPRPAEAFRDRLAMLDALHELAGDAGLICEYGSGRSTAALALGMPDASWLHSFEAEAAWAENTKGFVGNARVSFHIGLRVVRGPGGWPAWCHQTINVVPDLVFVDGPALTHKIPWTIEPLNYEAQMRAGARVVFDGRMANVVYFERFTTRRWSTRHDAISELSIFELED